MPNPRHPMFHHVVVGLYEFTEINKKYVNYIVWVSYFVFLVLSRDKRTLFISFCVCEGGRHSLAQQNSIFLSITVKGEY